MSDDKSEFDEGVAQGKEMMLNAPSVDIDVQQVRKAVEAYLAEHLSEERRDATAASIPSSQEAAATLLPTSFEGEMERHIRSTFGDATPTVYCLRAVVDEYFCRRRNGGEVRVLAQSV